MNEQVLVVFPHPDDEAFGVAGTILAHTQEGIPVTYVCLTLGDMGRNLGSPPFANRETLSDIRKTELDEACRQLGISDLRRFGIRDKMVEFTDQDVLAERIFDVIEDVNPSLVITFYPGYAVHPDHDAAGLAAVNAVKKLPKGERPTVYALAFKEGCEEVLGEPDVVRDVRPFAEQKLKVIEAHQSQTSGMIESMRNQLLGLEEDVKSHLTFERFWTYPVDEDD
ncbi:bacillithiol biosynthesis deacetylase BshB2 [Salisediminibacterium halotolerans]|uniref:Bacillithiol biosynthesis deacetylase BshB2 n=1 Tax=Salisediminibacterium halotolerans TaxID=517425 RepID=A0A1H9WPV6_9BACI|nr:bacillithiol biosynthesis deacetylase BshB2 [Salisediminibacterium haloalkalitolerans]SES35841.1 bacillithiol biosynthesis deacetylase BshB2 [Salisediminibacterium haloalkalitolerans]